MSGVFCWESIDGLFDRYDFLGLQAFGSGCDGELNWLTFLEGTIAFRLDSAVVDEYIISGLTLDKAVAL